MCKTYKIRKRNKKVVKFNEEKIEGAILNAFLDKEFRGAYKEDALEQSKNMKRRVINKIESQYKEGVAISVEDIQDIVEDVLMNSEYQDVAKSYIRYREGKALSRERFFDNQTKFIKTVEKITFEESEKNNLKRENANVDGNSAMGTMLQYGNTLSKDFAMTHILNPEHTKAHNNGDIHIHDLNFLAMGTTTCCQINLNNLFSNGFSTGHGFVREPQSIASYSALSAIAIQANQNEQHGGVRHVA